MVHVLAIMMVFMSLGAIVVYRKQELEDTGLYKFIMKVHGLGMILAFVAGFGLLAKLGVAASLPSWVILKMVVWLCVGGSVVLVKKFPQKWASVCLGMLGLGSLAAYLAIFKPF